jgi:hypothetical protein
MLSIACRVYYMMLRPIKNTVVPLRQQIAGRDVSLERGILDAATLCFGLLENVMCH